MKYSHKDFKEKPFLAVEDIASRLHVGSLMLFLGAGISKGFGLPSWSLFVARLLGKDTDETFVEELARKSDKELGKLIDDLDDGSSAYVDKLHHALYSSLVEDLADRFSRSPLLLAVAALLTGSCRGRVTTVITYNYDDLLKQYLEMLGYRVCVRTAPSALSAWADVEINHIHGYLPQSRDGESKASELVLSGKSYRARRADIDEGWSSYVEHGLYSKLGLFLGLSGDDGAILDVLKRAQKRIDRGEPYTGYWLVTPDAYGRNSKEILDVGMCPIRLEVNEFAKFVLGVCQRTSNA